MHSANPVRGTVVATLSVLAVMGMQPIYAEERTCVGILGSFTVDNLRVPSGKTCTLNSTRVKGTIKVGSNATLYARSVRVVGNIQAEGAKLVSVTGTSTVGGSIQIKQGGAATIYRARVNGDIQFESNTRALSATYNNVGGNLQAFQNKGGVRIAYNVIDGNLQCKENVPAPTGGGNKVYGSKEDQCRRL